MIWGCHLHGFRLSLGILQSLTPTVPKPPVTVNFNKILLILIKLRLFYGHLSCLLIPSSRAKPSNLSVGKMLIVVYHIGVCAWQIGINWQLNQLWYETRTLLCWGHERPPLCTCKRHSVKFDYSAKHCHHFRLQQCETMTVQNESN
jgi:hypothetical protein